MALLGIGLHVVRTVIIVDLSVSKGPSALYGRHSEAEPF